MGAIGGLVDLYFAKGAEKYVKDILNEIFEKSRKSITKKLKVIIVELRFDRISEFERFYRRNARNKQNNFAKIQWKKCCDYQDRGGKIAIYWIA